MKFQKLGKEKGRPSLIALVDMLTCWLAPGEIDIRSAERNFRRDEAETPPTTQKVNPLEGCPGRKPSPPPLGNVILLTQQLAAQVGIEHPQQVADFHDNLQFDWFRVSFRDRIALATISKKIASIVLEIVANSQQTSYQGTISDSDESIADYRYYVKSLENWKMGTGTRKENGDRDNISFLFVF